jgi:arylsulfatase A-like enzyme
MNINRRDFIKQSALAGAALSVAPARAAEAARAQRMNVVWILGDDIAHGAIHAFGNSEIRTPHLDRLAARGALFRSACCSYPICHVSRTEMITGRCLVGAGTTGARGINDLPFDAGWTLWPQLVQRSGWHTLISGKWHVPQTPRQDGFDETPGFYSGGGGPRGVVATFPRDTNGRRVTGYIGWTFKDEQNRPQPELGIGLTPDTDGIIAEKAIAGIRRAAGRPFFAQINFTSPHDPRQWPRGLENSIDYRQLTLPPNFRPQHPFSTGNLDGRDEVFLPAPRSEEIVKRERAVYFACVENLDRQVGRIVQALQETDELDRTLIIFTCDHGLAVGSHGLMGKQNQYEHTINVPLILAGPGIPAGKEITAQCCLRDLYPTFCELAGLAIPATVQGKSLVPVLRGERPEIHDAVFGYYTDVQRMVRDTMGWKLVWYPMIDRFQLFHLPSDPHELRDRIDDASERARIQQLKERLQAWQREFNDPLLVKSGRGAAAA